MAVFKCLGLDGELTSVPHQSRCLFQFVINQLRLGIPTSLHKAGYSRDISRGSEHERAWGEPPGCWRLLKAQPWSSAASLQKARHHSSSFERELGYNILTDQSNSLKLVIINKLDSLWDGCHFVFTKLKEDCSISAFSCASALSVHSPTFSLYTIR